MQNEKAPESEGYPKGDMIKGEGWIGAFQPSPVRSPSEIKKPPEGYRNPLETSNYLYLQGMSSHGSLKKVKVVLLGD